MKFKPKPPLHFLRVGKTGSSAVKHVLENWQRSMPYDMIWHPHKHSISQIPQGEAFCFFLRHPISRFQSGFESRKRQGQPRYNISWNNTEKQLFQKYPHANDLALALDSPSEEVRTGAEYFMYSHKHFFGLTYWMDIDSLNKRLGDIQYIGFQETLTRDFERLKIRLSLPASVRLPTSSMLAHKNPSPENYYLSDIARNILEEWFRKDIALFEYCQTLQAEIFQ